MGTKSVIESRTIWGALAMLISFILQQLKVDVALEDIDAALGQVAEVINLVTGIGGFLRAVAGKSHAFHRAAWRSRPPLHRRSFLLLTPAVHRRWIHRVGAFLRFPHFAAMSITYRL
ncbi:MAG: hypothetical protein QM680_10680 [Luteolibacter sp.]